MVYNPFYVLLNLTWGYFVKKSCDCDKTGYCTKIFFL